VPRLPPRVTSFGVLRTIETIPTAVRPGMHSRGSIEGASTGYVDFARDCE
jgi:hypothetical protein